MTREEIKEMMEGITPGPWQWTIEDGSMAILHGPDMFEDSVCSVGPCYSCCVPERWEWGKCSVPSEINANFIAAAPEIIRQLLAELEEMGQRIEELGSNWDDLKALIYNSIPDRTPDDIQKDSWELVDMLKKVIDYF